MLEPGLVDAPPPLSTADVEEKLARIWHQFFGGRGHSAETHILHKSIGLRRLVGFLKDVETQFGCKIQPSVLMRLGTVSAFAQAIISGNWPSPSSLVLLRDGTPEAALYIASAGSGLILEQCDLAALIDFPGQIWGLQLPGIDGETEPMQSVHDIARYYVLMIEDHDVGATLNLIGYSLGGEIVVEMARLMEARGRVVSFVGLLDTFTYEKYWPRSEWIRFYIRKTGDRIGKLRHMSLVSATAFLTGRMRELARVLGRRMTPANNTTSPDQSIYYIGNLEPDFQKVRNAAIIAFEGYRPTPIDRKLVMFRSKLGEPNACDPARIWRRMTKDFEVVVVPGSHATMIRKPFATTLAMEISQRLVRPIS